MEQYYVTQQTKQLLGMVFLEEFILNELVKKFLTFMEPESSLSHLQKPATGHYS
jgi:Mg/Co/Ni transporter MgtE